MGKTAQQNKLIKEKTACSGLSQLASSMQTSASSDLAKRKQEPKIRRVNDFIVYFDEITSMDQLGTVVIAQKVADLLDENYPEHEKLVVRPYVDPEKKIYACKIYETDRCSEDDFYRAFKEIKINNMLESINCVMQ